MLTGENQLKKVEGQSRPTNVICYIGVLNVEVTIYIHTFFIPTHAGTVLSWLGMKCIFISSLGLSIYSNIHFQPSEVQKIFFKLFVIAD